MKFNIIFLLALFTIILTSNQQVKKDVPYILQEFPGVLTGVYDFKSEIDIFPLNIGAGFLDKLTAYQACECFTYPLPVPEPGCSITPVEITEFLFYRSKRNPDRYVISANNPSCTRKYISMVQTNESNFNCSNQLIQYEELSLFDDRNVFFIDPQEKRLISTFRQQNECNTTFVLLFGYSGYYQMQNPSFQSYVQIPGYVGYPPSGDETIITTKIANLVYHIDDMEVSGSEIQTVAVKQIENLSEMDQEPIEYQVCLSNTTIGSMSSTDETFTAYSEENSASIGISVGVGVDVGEGAFSFGASVGLGFSFTNSQSQEKSIAMTKGQVEMQAKTSCFHMSCQGKARRRTVCATVIKKSNFIIPWTADKIIGDQPPFQITGELKFQQGVDIYQKVQEIPLNIQQAETNVKQLDIENFPLSNQIFSSIMKQNLNLRYLMVSNSLCSSKAELNTINSQYKWEFVRLETQSNLYLIRAKDKYNNKQCAASYLSTSQLCFDPQIYLKPYTSSEQLWTLEYQGTDHKFKIRSARSDQQCSRQYLSMPYTFDINTKSVTFTEGSLSVSALYLDSVRHNLQIWELNDLPLLTQPTKLTIRDFNFGKINENTVRVVPNQNREIVTTAFGVDQMLADENNVGKNVQNYESIPYMIEEFKITKRFLNDFYFENIKSIASVSVLMRQEEASDLANYFGFTEDFANYNLRHLTNGQTRVPVDSIKQELSCVSEQNVSVQCEVVEVYNQWEVDFKAKVFVNFVVGDGAEADIEGKITYFGVESIYVRIKKENLNLQSQ